MRNVWRTLLLCAVAAINIFSTLLPIWPLRYHVITRGLPVGLILGAQDVTLLLGVTMLLLAYPVANGHKRLTYTMMGCAALAIVSNVMKGLDVEEALINGVLLVTLWRGRHRLHAIPLRYTVIDVARLAVVLVIIMRVYTLIGRATLGVLHRLVQRGETAFAPAQHLQIVLTAKLALENMWFLESQFLLPIFLVIIFVFLSWTSLMRVQLPSLDTQDLYERFGRASHNSLAYLAQRSDVSTFVDANGLGAISYRQVGRVALQVGAILAPAGAREQLYKAFCAFCATRGLIPAAVALSEEEQPIARRSGMHTLMLGTEAVVDLAEFTVERLNKKMRWVQRSLTKRGYSAALVSATEITPQQRGALHRIDEEWRVSRGGQMYGCCMTLGRFPTPDDPACLVCLVNDPEGSPVAYLTLLPGGEGYYSLDLTRRMASAPNATMEYLMIEALSALKARGASAVSLNFSTFSGLASTRLGAALLKLCGSAFQLGSLETFNNKFRPTWVPRYAAYPSWYYLPDVTYAILATEGVDHMIANAAVRALRQALAPIAPGAAPSLEASAQADGL